MKIGKMQVTAERWPWQNGYNWKGMTSNRALLNQNGARFGAGWKYELGIRVGSTSVLINLVYGMICIRQVRK